jgi:hypothetical protein
MPAANERDLGRARSPTPTAPEWPEPFASALGAFVAHHDVPLIGERAATRGRTATEGGDERADVRRMSSVRAPAIPSFSQAGVLRLY